MNYLKLTAILLLSIGIISCNSLLAQNTETSQMGVDKFNLNPAPTPAIGSTFTTAIGLRGGETSGLTIKHFIGGNTAIEGIVGLWHHGIHLTGLFERHVNAFGESGLNWYYGGGAHLSVHTYGTYYGYGRRRGQYYDDGNFGLGVDGIVGLEYKIKPIPIAISLDIKPYIEVISNGRIWGSLDPGLGIKFTF